MAVLVAVGISVKLATSAWTSRAHHRKDPALDDGFWKSPSYTVGFSDKVQRCSDVGAASSHIGDEESVYEDSPLRRSRECAQ